MYNFTSLEIEIWKLYNHELGRPALGSAADAALGSTVCSMRHFKSANPTRFCPMSKMEYTFFMKESPNIHALMHTKPPKASVMQTMMRQAQMPESLRFAPMIAPTQSLEPAATRPILKSDAEIVQRRFDDPKLKETSGGVSHGNVWY